MDDGNNDKKTKGTKKSVIKWRLEFNNYKECLLNYEIILKSPKKSKSEAYNLYTKGINKITLSSNHDKRLKTFNRITSYTYCTSVGKVCKTKLLEHLNTNWLILMIRQTQIVQNII